GWPRIFACVAERPSPAQISGTATLTSANLGLNPTHTPKMLGARKLQARKPSLHVFDYAN
ncbi:MAG: hypothetical protein Q4B54_10815, partial [Coriobacteriales bacterium]|nr:hypothetical protein [Coriobacteriales bacterium]